MGSHILCHEGSSSHSHGKDRQHDELVQFVVTAPAGHDDGSKEIDIGLDKNIGKRGDDALDGRGQAHPENLAQEPPVQAQICKGKTVDIPGPQEDGHGGPGRDELGQDGGIGHTGNAPMESQDKEQVQEDVQDAGEDQEVQGPFRISHRPEDAAAHVVEEKAGDAGKVDSEVQRRLVEYIGRGLHETEHEIGAGQEKYGKQQTKGKGGPHGGLYGAVEQFVVFGSEIFADDHRSSDGEPIEEKYGHVGDHGGGTDGGQGLGPYEIPYDDGIHRIVQHLENIADHEGQGKFQDQAGNAARRHIFRLGMYHGITCLLESL